jgi:hypothetical protein
MKITNEILEGYLNCKTKGHLKLASEVGTRPKTSVIKKRRQLQFM